MNYSENRKKVTWGTVYFIKCGQYYKIGATKDVKSRLSSIRVTNPCDCELIHIVKTENMYLTERLFKSMFGRANLKGEWFSLTPENIEYIKSGNYSDAIKRSLGKRPPIIIPDFLGIAK
jgi:hypothetical protein